MVQTGSDSIDPRHEYPSTHLWPQPSLQLLGARACQHKDKQDTSCLTTFMNSRDVDVLLVQHQQSRRIPRAGTLSVAPVTVNSKATQSLAKGH